jgi:hypothetical protein
MGQQMAGQMGQAAGAAGQGGAAPPPLPAQDSWFFAQDGKQQGPLGMDALRGQLGGAVTRDTLVWKQGMAAWTPAGQVPELAPLFAAVPPPLTPE